jgi:2-iminobutanoate/2-iminopropanoate deaminase
MQCFSLHPLFLLGGIIMQVIHTDKAPAAVGPYSQAIKAGNTLYLSGQIAINPAEGKIVARTIEEQAEQCCRNIEAVLAAAGTDMSKVVKTTCFLAEIADFKAFNEVYAKHFISKPARSCVAVKDLPAGALCEIEAIVVIE